MEGFQVWHFNVPIDKVAYMLLKGILIIAVLFGERIAVLSKVGVVPLPLKDSWECFERIGKLAVK